MINHLKRLAMPKTWPIDRKTATFITKQAPGSHKLKMSMPISIILKEILKYAATTREAKKIIHFNEIKIDGKVRKDLRFSVGIFDTIIFDVDNFRMLIDRKGKLKLVKIDKDESLIKPCKIIGKKMINGKLQLNLYDGKNIIADHKKYKVGDSVLLSVPENKISKHLKLDKKSSIFLVGGKHIGGVGKIEDIAKNRITYKDENGNLIETLKKYAFVVGEENPSITVE